MRKIVKQIIPSPALRRIRTCLVRHNRRKIARRSKECTTIVLEPVNRVEHFFHFLFDLSLPLSRLIEIASPDTTFVVKDFGIFSNRLQEIFPDRVRIEKSSNVDCKMAVEPLLGMNPQFVHLTPVDLESFKTHVCMVFNIDQQLDKNKVLLIERLPPNPYFVHDAVKKGAGASRRSIPNHAELASAIQSIVKPPFEFYNVQLEEISFREQIGLFDRAALVIAQHGAGLANCVWMHRRSQVVELSHDLSLRHFQVISDVMNHGHYLYETSGSHTEINVDRLLSVLTRELKLSNILDRPVQLEHQTNQAR